MIINPTHMLRLPNNQTKTIDRKKPADACKNPSPRPKAFADQCTRPSSLAMPNNTIKTSITTNRIEPGHLLLLCPSILGSNPQVNAADNVTVGIKRPPGASIAQLTIEVVAAKVLRNIGFYGSFRRFFVASFQRVSPFRFFSAFLSRTLWFELRRG